MKKIILIIFVILTSTWTSLALWVQQSIITDMMLFFWLCFTIFCIYHFFQKKYIKTDSKVILYYSVILLGYLIWFFSLTPSNDRIWNNEVKYNVDYTQHQNIITVYHVRNFNWRTEQDYDIKWETRQYDLNQLDAVDLVVSTWGIDQIAHTLLTFRFKNGQKLAFSIETRKEQHEQFSSIAGFFRKYELAIIASDEKDVIFTRTNARTDEKTYIYPLTLSRELVQQLFLSYLQQGKALQYQPRWYNTLISNCTTVIYNMVKHIQPVPFDYRIIASGLLPEYLYEHQVIPHQYSLEEWKQRAYIQPKTQDFQNWQNQSSEYYSQVIRQDFSTD